MYSLLASRGFGKLSKAPRGEALKLKNCPRMWGVVLVLLFLSGVIGHLPRIKTGAVLGNEVSFAQYENSFSQEGMGVISGVFSVNLWHFTV